MLFGEFLRRHGFAEERLNHVQMCLGGIRLHLNIREQGDVAAWFISSKRSMYSAEAQASRYPPSLPG